MAKIEELKNYMKYAGENDALASIDEENFEWEENTKIELIIKEKNEELMQDWSSYGFDYVAESVNIRAEYESLKGLQEEDFHDVIAEAFYKYYVPAFLKKFENLAVEKLIIKTFINIFII